MVPVLFAALAGACGGSGEAPSGGSALPTPTPGSGSNPCTAALAAAPAASVSARDRSPKSDGFGDDDRDPRDFLALHLLPRAGPVSSRAVAAAAARSGDLAVLTDDGSLVVAPNPFDLRGVGVRFGPNGQGGYDVQRAGAAFRADLGERIRLADDDTSERALGFTFPFYGAARSSAFVNSDGNLTFGGGDVATTARSLGRVLSGLPRVAPFFADLDPSAGGGLFVSAAPDAFTVTWCAVPDFDATGKVTAQVSLLREGAVEVRIDGTTTLDDAVVALSPGSTTTFAAVDLSEAAGAAGGGSAAVGERFAAQSALDLVSASRLFYSEFADGYDQLVFWSDTRVVESGTFAYETTVQNAVAGIGQEIVALASTYGSGGRLASLVVMDDLGKYPADPAAHANGESSTLALVAHETGHRWGATLKFRDAAGIASDAWLGRQRAHWSFYCDSAASVLEGNDIEDQGGGGFRTVGAVSRYGPFDLYAMGLLAEDEVPRAFYVENPSGASQNRESAPRTGVSFSGTRREVSIGDVVAAMGHRNPPAAGSPRQHRQAWVYVVGRGRTADPAAIAKLEAIRAAFGGYFFEATGRRMSVETGL
ncbi:MAG TPA: hypothetical protein VLL75_08805 [Vicinamibacteria bacterium]|nr:hypothetical protein [Vicinamibacteria bacterium]